MKGKPMDCATTLAVKLQMLRFKASSMGATPLAILGPIIGDCDRAVTEVIQTLEDLAQIVHNASEIVTQKRVEVAQLRDLVTRITRARGGTIVLSKEDLERPIPKGTRLSNGILEDGGLEIVIDQVRDAA